MIHVLLMILKVFGILLLVLLILLAVLLLSVLFVPVRYRLLAVHTDGKTCGELRAIWFLHLLSVQMALKTVPEASDNDASRSSAAGVHTQLEMPSLPRFEKDLQVSVFGISLASIQNFLKKRRNKKTETGKTEKRRTQKRKTGKQKKQKRVRDTRDTDTGQKNTGQKNTGQKNTGQKNTGQEITGKKNTGNKNTENKNIGEESTVHQNTAHQKETFQDRKQPSEKQMQDNRNADERKALHKWRDICERIKRIPNQAVRLYRKLQRLLAKPGEMLEKASRLYRKLQKYEAAEVLKECREQIQVLFSHFRVRKGTGFLRFGTGDPALTGELTGVLYLLMPVSCGEISVEPQFTEKMFEINLSVRGHIRLIHLVRTIWWGFRNQRLRHLIRVFRHE